MDERIVTVLDEEEKGGWGIYGLYKGGGRSPKTYLNSPLTRLSRFGAGAMVVVVVPR